ncbi:MAG: penicillin-binding protein 2 [Ktedonobacteraceae bacterium]|nr:penicillin-binding protein 2 [Ktedonobacteraceae bacterium]
MNLSTSIRKLTLLFVVLFMALSAGLVYWQVIVAQQVTSNPHNARVTFPDSAPQRGKIYDRNGVLLAETVRTDNGTYIRHYTDPSLAGLLGYYVANYPATGVEAQFNDYLNGQVGSTALNNTVNKMLHRPPVGDNIYLTIDDRIQRIVDRDFDTPVQIDNNITFATDRGSVVVTDPHTGEVLAMVSRPSFDPNRLVQALANGDQTYYNQLAKDPAQPLIERPIMNRYIPGSVYKTVTLMAGLDSGKATLDQQFDAKQAFGPIRVGDQGNSHLVGINHVGSNLSPYTIHVPVTTQYGYAHSDNVIFAQVGEETGVDAWMEYNKRFYVTQNIPFDLPVTVSTVDSPNTPLNANLLGDDAFGQGTDFITPFQMSLVDDIPANNGQLMQPRLVSKIVDPNKTVVLQNQPQPLGNAQVSSTTAQQTLQAMYSVAQCGSGLVAGVTLNQSPWGIVAKTGTAQLGGNQPAHSWLITAAPYSIQNPNQMPALTIVAMKENGGEGGGANGPMVKNMYNDIFSQGLVKAQQPPAANPNYCCQSGMLQVGCPGVVANVPANLLQG